MNWRHKLPRDLFVISVRKSAIAVATTWIGIVAIWIVCSQVWQPISVIPAIILIGTLQYHLNILGHDGIHYLLFPNRNVNDSVCRWLLHAPQGMPLYLMRSNHFHHHRHLGEQSDSDSQYYNLSRFQKRSHFVLWLTAAPFGGMTLSIAKKLLLSRSKEPSTRSSDARIGSSNESHRKDWIAVAIVQSGIFLLLYLITGRPLSYFALWLVPLLTLTTGLNSLRSCLEHASWPESMHEERLYSFRSNALERFFLAPFNMNFHAEHHLVPAIPYRQLPALRHWLRDNAVQSGYEFRSSYFRQAVQIYRLWNLRQLRSSSKG